MIILSRAYHYNCFLHRLVTLSATSFNTLSSHTTFHQISHAHLCLRIVPKAYILRTRSYPLHSNNILPNLTYSPGDHTWLSTSALTSVLSRPILSEFALPSRSPQGQITKDEMVNATARWQSGRAGPGFCVFFFSLQRRLMYFCVKSVALWWILRLFMGVDGMSVLMCLDKVTVEVPSFDRGSTHTSGLLKLHEARPNGYSYIQTRISTEMNAYLSICQIYIHFIYLYIR